MSDLDHAPYAGGSAVAPATARDVATLAVAVAAYGVAFGVLGRTLGLSPAVVVGVSLLVYAGGSQMALLGVIAAGGAPLAGAAGGLVINSRFVAFGAVAAPLMQGGRVRRLVAAYLLTDEAATMALAQPDKRSQQRMFWMCGVTLWATWQLSTTLGVAVGQVLGDPAALGLDAAFPAAFLVLLMPLLRTRAERAAAVGGGVGALVGVPLLPAGLPVMLAMATGMAAALLVSRDPGEAAVTVVPAVLVLAVGTFALRLAGPALIGDREPPTWLRPAAVGAIAGMITLGAVDGGGALVADARLVGVAGALIALALRLPLALVILIAVGATALARLVGAG